MIGTLIALAAANRKWKRPSLPYRLTGIHRVRTWADSHVIYQGLAEVKGDADRWSARRLLNQENWPKIMQGGGNIMQRCSEYKCIQCGHDFNPLPWTNRDHKNEIPCCPRCGSELLEHNPYLLGTPDAEGLTPEDYFAVALQL